MNWSNMDDISFGGHIESAPNDIGTPLEDAMYAPGPQERVDSCAIRSQQHILSMYGINITESDLVQDAVSHGEYNINAASGTSLDDVGNLLERNGLEIHRYEEATMAHLISELAQGHKIIVGVDAYEIAADTLEERVLEMQKDAVAEIPNHALVVVNVDPNTMEVDVVDPSDGQLHRISADKFVDAWEDSNCFMVSTTKSPEEYMTGLGGTLDGSIQINTYHGEDGMYNMNIRAYDMNGDGIADIVEQDGNRDGKIEQLVIDTNHDGIADITVQSYPGLVNVSAASGYFGQAMDWNGDGIADAVGIDLDGNGTIDEWIDL